MTALADLSEAGHTQEMITPLPGEVQASGARARSYWYELFTTHEQPVEEQARQLAARILADDPRKTAELEER
ncbi:hypothetical protein [Streptomyces anulatus]|uniref:hypothetical protein n=1 Tax=Streptomyces anulatus TaxID=1892 RepID=UPI0036CB38BD